MSSVEETASLEGTVTNDTMMKSVSRREHDRVPVRVEVRICRGGALVRALMTNLSVGGFLVKAASPVQLDQRLPVQLGQRADVEFVIDGERFALEAALIRIEAEGVAFQFAELAAETRESLSLCLDQIEERVRTAAASPPVEHLSAVGSGY